MNFPRRFVTVLVAVLVGASAVAFAVTNRDSAGQLFAGLGSINLLIAPLGLACSVLAIANRGLLNRAAHHAVGLDAGVASMTKTAAVGFAAQKMVKSAGAVSLAVFVRHGRHRGHAAGPVMAACVLTASASFTALGVLLAMAIVVLAITGGLTGWWIAAAVGFGIYACAVALFAVVLVRDQRVAAWAWQRGQRLRRRIPWGRRIDDDAPFPQELLDAVASARSRPVAMRGLILHAVASKLLGALTLVAAVAAVGLPVSATGAVVIYATALAASLVTIVPGGFGTVEASTAALLIGSGATAGAAALAVALFRLFDLWLPVLTGAAVAKRDLRRERRNGHRQGNSSSLELARIDARAHLHTL